MSILIIDPDLRRTDPNPNRKFLITYWVLMFGIRKTLDPKETGPDPIRRAELPCLIQTNKS